MLSVEQSNTSIVNKNASMNGELNSDNENVYVRIYARVNINTSDIFEKNQHGLKTWLIQIKFYFKFNRIAKNKKISFATTYFRGRAEH